MIRTEKLITRQMLRASPQTLFVFGDNMQQSGYGGQAAHMRGEPNAVGIPTKWKPSMRSSAFFADSDLPSLTPTILGSFARLEAHLFIGGDVAWPEAGIGTGLAELPTRAPAVWRFIESHRQRLFDRYGC